MLIVISHGRMYTQYIVFIPFKWVIKMKEIPIPYVRTNQAAMVLFITASVLLQQPILILLLWVIQVVGLVSGGKGNLFIMVVKPLLQGHVGKFDTEAFELQRFNNSIAVILLTFSNLFLFVMPWSTAGYVFAGMVAIAALMALFGFCIGCFLYFQFKQFKHRRS